MEHATLRSLGVSRGDFGLIFAFFAPWGRGFVRFWDQGTQFGAQGTQFWARVRRIFGGPEPEDLEDLGSENEIKMKPK